MSASTLLIDGRPATVEDLSHIALVNYGAYTSFRVEGGSVRGLADHIARLQASAVELFGEAVCEDRLRELMRTALDGHPDAWLRVSLFSPEISVRSPSWRGRPRVMTAVSASPQPLASALRLTVQVYGREAAHLKHTSIFGLIRARREAQGAGFDDALFADVDGLISEGSLWNIGFIAGDTVVWPQAPMLAGVAQALIQRGLERAGFRSEVGQVRVRDLSGFDGAFICNSATPACAVTAIDAQVFVTSADRVEAIAAAWASNPIEPI